MDYTRITSCQSFNIMNNNNIDNMELHVFKMDHLWNVYQNIIWPNQMCVCVGCPSETLGWGMKVWWWWRSLRTESQNTWTNWSTSVWLPPISNTLYLGFTCLSSSHSQSRCVFVDEPCVTLCVVCVMTESWWYEAVYLWTCGVAADAEWARGNSSDEHVCIRAGQFKTSLNFIVQVLL